MSTLVEKLVTLITSNDVSIQANATAITTLENKVRDVATDDKYRNCYMAIPEFWWNTLHGALPLPEVAGGFYRTGVLEADALVYSFQYKRYSLNNKRHLDKAFGIEVFEPESFEDFCSYIEADKLNVDLRSLWN